MKAIPLVLLSLATATVAIVAYDQLQAEPEPRQAADVGNDAELLQRLDDLEADRRRSRRGGAVEASILERLRALETSSRPPPAAAADPRAPDPVPAATPSPLDDLPNQMIAGGEPTAGEIREFRRLQDAVRREDTIRKLEERVDKQLASLPVNLTDAQRERVTGAFADFRPRIGELWGEARAQAKETVAAGGQVDRATIVADTTALIQQEFAATLEGVVASGDAEMIAAALLSQGK